MKLAIISDIHANATALKIALAAIRATPGVDRIICLGDVVGFHTQPGECIELVRANNIRCISGNHDAGVAGKLGEEKFPWECWEAIEWTRKELDRAQHQFLQSLSTMTAEGRQFWMMHGVLGDVHHYMNREWKVRYVASRLWLARCRFGFFGHTHTQTCYRIGGLPFAGTLEALDVAQPISLDDRSTYLINPGTIGQPRTRDSHVRFAFIDFENRLLTFERIPYDYASVTRQTLNVFPRHAPLYKRFDSQPGESRKEIPITQS